MTNITTTTDKLAESYPGNVSELMGRRAAVVTGAAHFLGLREFVVAESARQVNEAPAIDNTMPVEGQRAQISDLQPFDPAVQSDSVQTSNDNYITAITPDVPIDNSGSVDSARARLVDIFADGGIQ